MKPGVSAGAYGCGADGSRVTARLAMLGRWAQRMYAGLRLAHRSSHVFERVWAKEAGRAMGFFSFLLGSKKTKDDLATKLDRKTATVGIEDANSLAASHSLAVVNGSGVSGAEQVRVRLRLAASMRSGRHAEAYAAARRLADIQARAGRRSGQRLWSREADRILERMG